jgi:hypothetical protein
MIQEEDLLTLILGSEISNIDNKIPMHTALKETSDWHVTRDFKSLLTLRIGTWDFSNVILNKCVCKTILALKINQL